jgi:hypothetical protein
LVDLRRELVTVPLPTNGMAAKFCFQVDGVPRVCFVELGALKIHDSVNMIVPDPHASH